MSWLVLGIVVFFAVHLLPTVPALRAVAVEKLGGSAYKGTYSALAAAGLVMIIWGKVTADFVPLWEPPTWGRPATLPLMLVALILLAASHMPGNIKRITRHPMLWGIALWGLAHLAANGDLASLLLFGSFLSYTVIDGLSVMTRNSKTPLETQPIRRDLIAVIAGAVAFGVLLFLHPYLFGVPAII